MVPGFAVGLVSRSWFLSKRMKFDVGDFGEQLNRKYVPKLLRDDLSDEEVNLFGGVHASVDAAASMNAVRTFANTRRGL